MADSISRAGSTAKTFGVTLDELNGLTAGVATTTRLSGANIGNAFKTIFSRITTMKNSETTLKNVGVAMKDLNGEVRPVYDILTDLAERWHTLSSEQQQSTATILAG